MISFDGFRGVWLMASFADGGFVGDGGAGGGAEAPATPQYSAKEITDEYEVAVTPETTDATEDWQELVPETEAMIQDIGGPAEEAEAPAQTEMTLAPEPVPETKEPLLDSTAVLCLAVGILIGVMLTMFVQNVGRKKKK